MSEPSAFEAPLVGDIEPGDRWFVAGVNRATGMVRFERVRAQPGQFRGLQPDGLWPRLPPVGSRPISAEEARALADEMEASMAEHGRYFADAARKHNEQLAAAMQAELAAVEGPEPAPLTAEEAGRLMAEGVVDAVDGAWAASGLRSSSPGPFADLDCEEG